MDTSSITRLTGLATGLDTDSVVKKLMKIEQIPLDQLKQKQQKEMWLSDAYRQWNADLFTFQTNTLFNMKLSSTYNTFDVSSSQPNSVSGTATSNAIAGTYTIAVKQVAQSATFTSNKVMLDPTKPLGDAAQGARQLTADTSIIINVYNDPQNPLTLQSATVAIKTTDTINDVIAKINSATDATGKSLGLQAMYDSNLQQFILRTKATGASTKIDLSSNTSTFLSNTLGIGTNASVTGSAVTYPVSVTGGMNDSLTIDLGGGVSSTLSLNQGTYHTPQDLVQEINDEIGKNITLATKVSASVDATGKITLTSAATGTQSSITVSGNGSSAIGLVSPASGTGGTGTLVTTGQNADIVFNGNEINTLSTNNITVMGINFSLKSPTVDASGNPTTSSITVSRNIDAEVKNIEDFVTKYNDLLDRLNKANNEPVYKDYQPLTDDQRSAMSDKQIELWEAKAKSGLLRGDSIISGLINKMRNDMSSLVSNGSSYNSLASIGISSKSYQDRGKLYVDETKLRAAIQNDPDGVRNLFSQIGDTATGTNGLVHRLSDDIQQAIKDLTNKGGMTGNSPYDQSVIGKLLASIQTDITRQTDKMNKKEDQYYKQFAAMEAAVAKFNSQSSWLFQQLGGGQ
jgi:flagellar hook-associated protein 2